MEKEMGMDSVEILGIDLGTTNSAIAIWEPETGLSRILENNEGQEITPSVVAFLADREDPIVGNIAVQHLLSDPDNVVYSVKRFIGRPYEHKTVQQDQEQITYTLEESEKHQVAIRIGRRHLSPSLRASYVLSKLKK